MDARLDDVIVLRPDRPFEPVPLVADDLVPTSMVFLLAYPYRIESAAMAQALQAGLNAFPHLAGEIAATLRPLRATIEPGDAGVRLETAESHVPLSMATIETLSHAEQFRSFTPSSVRRSLLFTGGSNGDEPAPPLLQARLTWLPETGVSVLGMQVSHIAVDGTGLALFLAHCTAAVHGRTPRPVFHDRSLLMADGGEDAGPVPDHYYDATDEPLPRLSEWNAATRCEVAIFTVAGDRLRVLLGVDSLRDARFGLTALVGAELAKLHPPFAKVALWCDPRGTGGIPRTYTGNVGCYLHLPIHDDHREVARAIRGVAGRDGFARLTRDYRAIKAAEARGRLVVWAAAPDVLPVNLVPFERQPAYLDFGGGMPGFAHWLTRNSHGVRVWVAPDGGGFMVEATLPAPLPARLLDRFRAMGLVDAVRDGL